MGKKQEWMTYAQARLIMHDEDIGSRSQYLRWHEINKPYGIPKNPNRVYKDWVGWNDFLDNDNVASMAPKRWRTIEEAMALLHPMKISSQKKYNELLKGGELPDDLPSNPKLVYDKWVTWSHYLGTKVAKKVEAVKAVKEAQLTLLVVAHYNDRPGGVYGIFIVKGGEPQLRDMQQSSAPFTVMKKFKLDDGYDWKAMVALHGKQWSDWQARNNEYMIPNVNQMIFDLSCDLLFA